MRVQWQSHQTLPRSPVSVQAGYGVLPKCKRLQIAQSGNVFLFNQFMPAFAARFASDPLCCCHKFFCSSLSGTDQSILCLRQMFLFTGGRGRPLGSSLPLEKLPAHSGERIRFWYGEVALSEGNNRLSCMQLWISRSRYDSCKASEGNFTVPEAGGQPPCDHDFSNQ